MTEKVASFLAISLLFLIWGCVGVTDITGTWKVDIIDEVTMNFFTAHYTMWIENVSDDGNLEWELGHERCSDFSGSFDFDSNRVELTFECLSVMGDLYHYKMSGEVSGNTMGGTLYGKLENEHSYEVYGTWSATKVSDQL